MGTEAGPELRPHHLPKALHFCSHVGGSPSHSVPTQGPSPAWRQPLRMLRVAGRGPLSNWTQGLGLGGAPAFPASVSSPCHHLSFWGGGLHIRLHMALRLPQPHHQTQQTRRKQALLSPQTLPERSSGFLEENPGLRAWGLLGLGATWGPVWVLLLFRHLSVPLLLPSPPDG